MARDVVAQTRSSWLVLAVCVQQFGCREEGGNPKRNGEDKWILVSV